MPRERKPETVPAYKLRQLQRAESRERRAVLDQLSAIKRSLDRWDDCGALLSEQPAAALIGAADAR